MKYSINPVACLLGLALSLAPVAAFAETYTYDSSGRLTSVTYDDNSTIRYSYDAAGNMVKRAVTDGSIESTVPSVLEQIADFRAAVKVPKKAKKDMQEAEKKLQKAQGKLDDGNVKSGLKEVSKAAGYLIDIRKRVPNAQDWIDQLVRASRLKAQGRLDEALAAAVSDPDLLADAQAKMTAAQTQLDKNKQDKAIKQYEGAWDKSDKAILPDIRGTYNGTYSYKSKKCKKKKDNIKLDFTVVITITSVNGAGFSGTAVGSTMLDGVPVEDSFTIEGTIDYQGDVSGNTTRSFLATTGKGKFSGELVGDNLTLKSKGKDKTGDRCKYLRKIDADR